MQSVNKAEVKYEVRVVEGVVVVVDVVVVVVVVDDEVDSDSPESGGGTNTKGAMIKIGSLFTIVKLILLINLKLPMCRLAELSR